MTITRVIATFTLILGVADASAAHSSETSSIRFIGPEFAEKLCEAWNKSELPSDLGTEGSDWISAGKLDNTQSMHFWSNSCEGEKIELKVENRDGKAWCVYGGKTVTADPDWTIYPNTWVWYRLATGPNPMMHLMGSFSGPMGVAMSNMSNFTTFFQVVGKLAKEESADYMTGCNIPERRRNQILGFLKEI